jgi:hypothetical protein
VKVATWLTIVAASAGGLWIACSTTDIHIFIAGQYLANLDCVTPGYAVDVLDGPAVDASCDATCVVPPFEAGVFVTGACAPFPPGDDTSGHNPLCAKALAAARRSDLCLEGGPSNPLVDAGSDHAVVDAGSDRVVADVGPSHDARGE